MPPVLSSPATAVTAPTRRHLNNAGTRSSPARCSLGRQRAAVSPISLVTLRPRPQAHRNPEFGVNPRGLAPVHLVEIECTFCAVSKRVEDAVALDPIISKAVDRSIFERDQSKLRQPPHRFGIGIRHERWRGLL